MGELVVPVIFYVVYSINIDALTCPEPEHSKKQIGLLEAGSVGTRKKKTSRSPSGSPKASHLERNVMSEDILLGQLQVSLESEI